MSARGYGEFLPIRPITPTITTPWLARIGVFGSGTPNFSSRIAVDTTTGNFYIGGRDLVRASPQLWGFAVSKYSSTGQILWKKVIGEFNTFASVLDCCVDNTGNIYFVGAATYTSGQPAGYTTNTAYDGYFGKLNSTDGSTAFLKRFSFRVGSATNWTDSLEGIAYSAIDNTVVITGRTPRQTSATAGAADSCYVAKYNTSGTQIWQYIYFQSFNIYGSGISVDNSGIIYICGYSNNGSTNNILISLNTNGSFRWAYGMTITGGGGNLYPYRVTTTTFGNVALAQYGSAVISGSSKYVLLVTLFNSSGSIVWQTPIDNNRNSGRVPTVAASTTTVPPTVNPVNLIGMARDSANNIYVAVCGVSSTVTDSILLYKFRAADGVALWIRNIYVGTSNSSIWVRPTGLNCVGDYLYVVGTSNSESPTLAQDGNYLFAKLPIDGSITNTNGYTVSTGISYIINDVGANHPLVTAISGTIRPFNSNTFSNVFSYSSNTMTDVSLTSNNLNFVIETKTI
jgi:hypothetical protein